MFKKLLTFVLVLLGFSQLYANPIDATTARRVGESFARTTFADMSKSDELCFVKATDSYFVFNVGATGFVIVSADDSFRPIIGYSDEGMFPTENPSPEMMYYLDNLSQGRQAALRASVKADAQVKREWTALLKGEKMPSRNGGRSSFYLLETRWNQNSPYNKFCPSEGGRTYAGCVATAMSQVMNYWKYPTHGYGHHSYVHYQYGELSADFSAAEYNFDLMPNSISDGSPVENIDAIALFMYHCGIAVDMSYGTDGSGAYSEDVPDAILKYFGYTNCCRMVYRDECSLGEFQALLKNQLDLGWPCYYSGSDTDGSGGHAFVCDGYDDNDMFHFNWGWSGSGNNFFVIDELNVSGYAFNSGQAFTANYVPAEVFANTVKSPDAFVAVPNGDDSFTVTLSWVNPTTTLQGVPINAIEQIVVMRDNRVIQTFENPVPGEAVTFVDPVGQPVTVNYTVHAVCEGYAGRKAHADGINLGPTCLWTMNLTSGDASGWGDGGLSVINSSGVQIAELTAENKEVSYQIEVPQGRIAFFWEAPSDSLQVGMEILDADGKPVFIYDGPSTLMPQGFFYETVNTCGGNGTTANPTNLKAAAQDNDVVLTWTGIANPGYGYNVYRDGSLYTMTSQTTYTDVEAAQDAHRYFITAFCVEGETDPSNTVCAVLEDNTVPRNFDFELLQNFRVKLTWEKPLNDENLVGYAVYRKAQGEDYKRVKLLNANATNYTDNFNVPDGNHYFYKIVSVSERANEESMPARSLRNPDLLYVELNRSHIPSGLTLVEQDNQVQLQWEQALLAETYNVYRNGELLAEGITEPQYTNVENGEPSYYQVTGVLNGVESSPSNKVYYANYAVGETNEPQTALFPNPSKRFVTVKAEALSEVVVYNVTGQQLMRSKVDGNELTMDLSGLDAGVYYFRINTDQGHRVQKVVLVK